MSALWGSIGFTAPALLAALVAVPVLWWLLRAVPPAPARRRFPGVVLLQGLRDARTESDRTPWWLMLLRALAVAAIIIGFAGPVLNPRDAQEGQGPLLIVADASWASAPDWERRKDRMRSLLAQAGRDGRPVAVVSLSDPPASAVRWQSAAHWRDRLAGVEPAAWAPQPQAVAAWQAQLPDEPFETWWFSDGLARAERATLLEELEARGPVTVVETGRPVLALNPARFEDGLIHLRASRAGDSAAASVTASAIGRDPAGTERVLAQTELGFAADADTAETTLALQPELRNRITRFRLDGHASAGAVSLTDDALTRRKVALLAPASARDERLELLSPLFYLTEALAPVADLVSGATDVETVLAASPEVIVMADIAQLDEVAKSRLEEWMRDDGGLLVRFAGPRLASSDVGRDAQDPLLPVRLRSGGRVVGGAMSWGEPRHLAAFDDDSPFAGLTVPDDVTVSSQVLAQPGPELSQRSIATLADGTPLVTRRTVGAGQVVLFHVTANAEWSTLPLSGVFVQMLERLAVSAPAAEPTAEALEGTTWEAVQHLDAFGALGPARDGAGVAGTALVREAAGPSLPPGLYADGARRLAHNVVGSETTLAATSWPARIAVEGPRAVQSLALGPAFLVAGLALLLLDLIATLGLTGRLLRRAPGEAAATTSASAAVAGVVMLAALVVPQGAAAQDAERDDARALQATSEVVLAHVVTGQERVDEIAAAGMRGLSRVLTRRSSVEPGEPMAVDIERDELAFFPMLYWPVTAEQPLPSREAYSRLNQYLRAGGMIVFDTRDADMADLDGETPESRHLQRLARPLDIPPLERVPEDHVLTRTFYLLQEFPGRYNGRDVWVEAAPADAERAEGMPFRNRNDGVTPVVIGGHDWAAAWAMDESGSAMVPVGRGYSGQRQRETAYRFGVNLVMHVLTGNYKSDQVHVPALLERLGQ